MVSKTALSAYVPCKDTFNENTTLADTRPLMKSYVLILFLCVEKKIFVLSGMLCHFLCLPSSGQVKCSEFCKTRYDFKKSLPLLKIKLFFNHKLHMLFEDSFCFSSPLTSFRWHHLQQIQSWASPSYRASSLQTLTPAWPQTTLSFRRSVPRMTLWSSILRGMFRSHTRTPRRKVLPSPSTQSSTYRCFSCTVRCLCAPRCLRPIQNFHQYVVSFLYPILWFWTFKEFSVYKH